jgi:hypothetical protein
VGQAPGEEGLTYSLSDLWRETGDFRTDPRFYAYVAAHPKESRAMIAMNWSRKGEFSGVEMMARLEEALGPRYLGLMMDPGIVCRLDDFLQFAKSRLRARGPMGPVALRDLYSKHLKTSRVWRGTMVSSEVADLIEDMPQQEERAAYVKANNYIRTRIRPGSGPYEKAIQHNSRLLFFPLLADPPGPTEQRTYYQGYAMLAAHHTQSTEPLFVSFSRKIEVTYLVASLWSLPTDRFMLMGVEVPELELIKLGGPFYHYPSEVYRYPAGRNPTFQMRMSDPEYEVLLLGDKQPKAEPKEVHIYSEPPAQYQVAPCFARGA